MMSAARMPAISLSSAWCSRRGPRYRSTSKNRTRVGNSSRRKSVAVIKPKRCPSPSVTGTPSTRSATISDATSAKEVSGATATASAVMISRASMTTLQFLRQDPENLRDAPPLRKAAPRPVGRIAVEDLGNLPQGSFRAQVAAQRLQEAAGGGQGFRRAPAALQERRHVRPEQPRPHGALMIRRVPPPLIAHVLAPVTGVIRRQGPEAHRGQEPLGHERHDPAPVVRVYDRKRQGCRQELVGSMGGVGRRQRFCPGNSK